MIFDGFDFSHMMKVENVERSLVPDMTVSSEAVGSPGEVFKSTSMGARTLKVDVRIIAPARDLDGQKMSFEMTRRVIAARLARTTLCDLVLDDAPDVRWRAVLNGSTDLDRFLWTGGTTLEFYSPTPWAFGKTRTKDSPGGEVGCNVLGNVATAPVVTVHADASDFTVYFDEVPFALGGNVTSSSPVVIDAANNPRTTTKGGAVVKVGIECDYPEWTPGMHTVSCDHPFTVEWEERWI